MGGVSRQAVDPFPPPPARPPPSDDGCKHLGRYPNPLPPFPCRGLTVLGSDCYAAYEDAAIAPIMPQVPCAAAV